MNDHDERLEDLPCFELTRAQLWRINALMQDHAGTYSTKIKIFHGKPGRYTHTYVRIGKREWHVSKIGKATELNVEVRKTCNGDHSCSQGCTNIERRKSGKDTAS